MIKQVIVFHPALAVVHRNPGQMHRMRMGLVVRLLHVEMQSGNPRKKDCQSKCRNEGVAHVHGLKVAEKPQGWELWAGFGLCAAKISH